ncbi:MAG: tail fiber domain-containing protein [Anaerolineae bacterium]
MNKKWSLLLTLTLLAAIVGLGTSTTAAQGPGDGPVAAVSVGATRIEWQPLVSYAGLILTVSGPDGLVFRQEFGAGSVPSFESSGRPDGSYTYELRVIPVVDAETRQALDAARESGDRTAVVSQLQREGKLPQQPLVQSGYLSIEGGAIVMGGALEDEAVEGLAPSDITPMDVPYYDDVIITGSLCVGFDCVDGESFAYDTIRLKEHNLRIHFEDTSYTADFPTNDWRILINDTTIGGANYFAIEDSSAEARPFTIEAGAPAHSLYVEDYGRVGLGTSTPWVELHIVDGDTPTVRLEQDWTAGWTPQTWEVAGNESNFFIRDVTKGSKLPFRIRPGAPDNSIFIKADGNVGIGTSLPDYPLEVERMGTDATFVAERSNGATAKFSAGESEVQLGSVTNHNLKFIVNNSPVATLNAGGNLTLDGSLTELSDANAKENLAAVDGEDVLARLAEVPITTWSFKADDPSVRHMGPTAQDFYAAFGLGQDERHIAPLDTNGVALAGVQELYQMVQEKDAQIAQLQQQNAELEERLEALERLVNSLLQE